jgi:hypothetical protein
MTSSRPALQPARPSPDRRTRGAITAAVAHPDVIAGIALGGVFLAGCLVVGPLRDVPVIDDWTYAWSVEHLLQTGEVRIAEISAVYPVLQILWGTAAAWVFGFSFGVLRLSTVAVAVLGCWALYRTLQELSCGPAWSLIGALALAVHPVYFALAFTFMTDVPMLALSLVSILFAVQAFERQQPQRLWISMAFAVAAFLIRATAVITPAAVLLLIPWRRPDRLRWMMPIAVALASIAIAWLVMHHVFGPLQVETRRFEQLQWLALVPLKDYAEWNASLLGQASLPFVAVLAPAMATRRALVVSGIASIALALSWLSFGTLPNPLPDWETWSLQDIGAGRVLILGTPAPAGWTLHVAPVLSVIGAITTAALVVALVSSLRARRRALMLMPAMMAVHLVVINALWMYNDRYYLSLVPAITCAAAVWARRVHAPIPMAAALLGVLGLVSISGTRDMLDVNEAVARGARDLEAMDVRSGDIDAGWALNGWRLWAHPEHLSPGVSRTYGVPQVTSKTPTPYAVASVALPGYEVIRTMPLPHAWWQASDRVYVLRRQAAAADQ